MCQRLALVEMHLLARARRMLISQPSAFSDGARFLHVGRCYFAAAARRTGEYLPCSRKPWLHANAVCGTAGALAGVVSDDEVTRRSLPQAGWVNPPARLRSLPSTKSAGARWGKRLSSTK